MSKRQIFFKFRRFVKGKFFGFIFIAAIWSLMFCSMFEIMMSNNRNSILLESKNKISEFKMGITGNFELSAKEIAGQGPGENGEPVDSEGHQEEVNEANRNFGFNTYVSDKISLNRTIQDTRPAECAYWHYPTKLPKTTVCIVFHNEGWTPLLRTVHSVLNRSPADVLVEVLLIDDCSDKDHLKTKLDDYIKQFNGRVRILRNAEREGLIRSKSIGGEHARGEVVVFLDAHCEVNTNWLPPLLAPIVEDSRTVTIPVIDNIDANTWAYRPQYGNQGGQLFRGIFEWGLLYKEMEIPPEEYHKQRHASEPFSSPTHAGGLFAINRSWFEKLGWYDPGMQIWGGENYELSFKVWQCGGRVLNVPCSHVGHVYRNNMPYTFGKFSGKNYKRVAEVWMDEYKEYYYIREPFMRFKVIGDLTKQVELRKKNKCKSFDWFMKNVAFDLTEQYPLPSPNVVWGEMRNEGTDKCMDTMGQPIPGTLSVYGCHHGDAQMFRLNQKGQMSHGEWCITAVADRLQTSPCNVGSDDGAWEYRSETKQMYNRDRETCLTVDGDVLTFTDCDSRSKYQIWMWTELTV